MTRCQPRILTPYLDRELTEDARIQVEEHLRSCPTCGALLDEVSVAAQRVQDLGRASIPRRELEGAARTFSERARLVPPRSVAVVEREWDESDLEEETSSIGLIAEPTAAEPPAPEPEILAPEPVMAAPLMLAVEMPEVAPHVPQVDTPADDLQLYLPEAAEPPPIAPPAADIEPEAELGAAGSVEVEEEGWAIAWTGASLTAEDGPHPHEPIKVPPLESLQLSEPVQPEPEEAPTAAFWEGLRALEQEIPAEPVLLNTAGVAPASLEIPQPLAESKPHPLTRSREAALGVIATLLPALARVWALLLGAARAVAHLAVIGWSGLLTGAGLLAGFAVALAAGIRMRLRREPSSPAPAEPRLSTAWDAPVPFREPSSLGRSGAALRTRLAGATVWRRGPDIGLAAGAVVVVVVLAITAAVVLGQPRSDANTALGGGTAASQTIVPTAASSAHPSAAPSPLPSQGTHQGLTSVITIGSGGSGYRVARIRSGVPAAGTYRLVFELDGSGPLPTAQVGRAADGKDELAASGISVDPSVVSGYSPGGPITAVSQSGLSGMNILVSFSQPQSHSLSYLPAGNGLPARLYIDFSK